MFSKAIVLIFLTLGLSSSVAHAIPSQNRAQVQDPCTGVSTTTPSSPKSSNTVQNPKDNSSAKKDKNVPNTGNTPVDKGGDTTKQGGGGNPQGSTNTTANSNKTGGNTKTAGNTPANKNVGNQGNGNNNDPQTSQCLDPKVISKGLENNGQKNATAGQVASLTSSNNFINFCLTVNKPLTNGQQVKTGSCNVVSMGVIAATTNMPSSKFVSPQNLGTVKANTAFTIKMALNNLEAGNFVNAESNYYAAPQQVNAQGNIIGHTHFTVQAIDSMSSTNVLDPNKFAFFKGVNTPADKDGIVSADVTNGLPAGTYRLASINTGANHQPALVAVAQHGSLDDMIYFTVTDNGNAGNSNNPTNNPAKSAATGAGAKGTNSKGNKAVVNASCAEATPTPSPSSPPPGKAAHDASEASKASKASKGQLSYRAARRFFDLEIRRERY